MYTQHFGLSKSPFDTQANAADAFVGPHQAKMISRITSALAVPDSIIAIGGPVGVGKTTLVDCALEGVKGDHVLIRIGRLRLEPDDILGLLLDNLELDDVSATGTIQRVEAVSQQLKYWAEKDKRLFIIVEDAQRLGIPALLELESLTAGEGPDSPGAAIVLMGHSEMHHWLAVPDLMRVSQRTRLRQTVEPFNAQEVQSFLMHCLRTAGGEFGDIIRNGTVEVLHSFSGGVARVIKNLCESTFKTAAGANLKTIAPQLVAKIATDVYGLQPDAGNMPDLPPVPRAAPRPLQAGEVTKPEIIPEPQPATQNVAEPVKDVAAEPQQAASVEEVAAAVETSTVVESEVSAPAAEHDVPSADMQAEAPGPETEVLDVEAAATPPQEVAAGNEESDISPEELFAAEAETPAAEAGDEQSLPATEATTEPAAEVQAEEESAPLEESQAAAEESAPVEELPTAEELAASVEEVQAAEEEAVPTDELQAAEVQEAEVDEVQAAEEELTPADELHEAEEQAAPVDGVQAAEEELTPTDELQEAEEQAAPVDELQAAEEEAAPTDELQEAEEDIASVDEMQAVEEEAAPKDELQVAEEDAAPANELQAAEEIEEPTNPHLQVIIDELPDVSIDELPQQEAIANETNEANAVDEAAIDDTPAVAEETVSEAKPVEDSIGDQEAVTEPAGENEPEESAQAVDDNAVIPDLAALEAAIAAARREPAVRVASKKPDDANIPSVLENFAPELVEQPEDEVQPEMLESLDDQTAETLFGDDELNDIGAGIVSDREAANMDRVKLSLDLATASQRTGPRPEKGADGYDAATPEPGDIDSTQPRKIFGQSRIPESHLDKNDEDNQDKPPSLLSRYSES